MQIFPSILGVSSADIPAAITSVSSADRLHIDVMDNTYTDSVSFIPSDFSDISINMPVDVHIMAHNPIKYIEEWVMIHPMTIFVQAEVIDIETLHYIQSLGVRSGVAVDLYTDIKAVDPMMLQTADEVLIMTVKAGAGGQQFESLALEKIAYMHQQYPEKPLLVDGGITPETMKHVLGTGVMGAVVGSYLMHQDPEKRAEAITMLRSMPSKLKSSFTETN